MELSGVIVGTAFLQRGVVEALFVVLDTLIV